MVADEWRRKFSKRKRGLTSVPLSTTNRRACFLVIFGRVEECNIKGHITSAERSHFDSDSRRAACIAACGRYALIHFRV